MKKAQISFEFILIFTLVFFTLIGFIYLINSRLSDISKQQEMLTMRHLAENIKNEVILASSVNNYYIRRFDIPSQLDGRDYKMNIENEALTIQVFENGRVMEEYFTILPTRVKGDFIEDINFENTEHCITKNNIDGIRIARNQASLDTNKTTYSNGDEFDVIVGLNCVENIRSVQFSIRYDPKKLQLVKSKVKPITQYERNLNPLFDDVTVLDYTNVIFAMNKTTTYPYVNDTLGRFTYGFIGDNCATGSGNIAKLAFRVITTGPNTTTIDFEKDFGDQNIVILDCETNIFTKEDLPDSKKSALVEIV